ncbi:MAG: hypothetical protein ACE5HI_17005 [bacterium]
MQIATSKNSMKISNRPYIVVENIRPTPFEPEMFEIMNYGTTPSFHTKIFYSVAEGGDDFTPNRTYQDSIITQSVIGLTDHPRGVSLVREIGYPEQYQNQAIFCYGEVAYVDIFNDKHGYRFCFQTTDGYNWKKYKNYNYAF